MTGLTNPHLPFYQHLKNLSFDVIHNNCLEGYFYKNFPELISPNDKSLFHAQFTGQWNKILIHDTALVELAHDFISHGLRPVVLKGMSFVDDLYPDLGQRYMSDIDLLVSENELLLAGNILEKNYYKKIIEDKWIGNDYKITYEKEMNGSCVVIEIHTRIFFHTKAPLPPFLPWKHAPYQKLTPDMNLLHLIGHASLSHTFIKIFWLIDIYRFLKCFENQIDWEQLIKLTHLFKLRNSSQMVFHIMERYFSYFSPVAIKKSFFKEKLYQFIFTIDFLFNCRNYFFRYYVIKHLTKDSFITSLGYDLFWLHLYMKRKIWKADSSKKQ